MKPKRTPELVALQEAFKLHVLFAGDPDGRPLSCWFREVDERPCEGPARAAHFLKRQRVEKALGALLPREIIIEPEPGREAYGSGLELPDWRGLIQLAAWDPRIGVPSCAAHDDRHDGHQMPPLVVPADKVPLEVVEFATDWGLECQLEDRSPDKELP